MKLFEWCWEHRAITEYRRVRAAPPRFTRERDAAAALLASLKEKP